MGSLGYVALIELASTALWSCTQCCSVHLHETSCVQRAERCKKWPRQLVPLAISQWSKVVISLSSLLWSLKGRHNLEKQRWGAPGWTSWTYNAKDSLGLPNLHVRFARGATESSRHTNLRGLHSHCCSWQQRNVSPAGNAEQLPNDWQLSAQTAKLKRGCRFWVTVDDFILCLVTSSLPCSVTMPKKTWTISLWLVSWEFLFYWVFFTWLQSKTREMDTHRWVLFT